MTVEEKRAAILRKYGIEPDPVIEAYKKDIDRTLIRENLKLTVEQRFQKMMDFGVFIDAFRGCAQKKTD